MDPENYLFFSGLRKRLVEWFPVQHTSYQHFKSWWNGQYILPSDGRLWILYRYLANFHPKKQRFTQVPGNGCLVGGQFSQHFWHKKHVHGFVARFPRLMVGELNYNDVLHSVVLTFSGSNVVNSPTRATSTLKSSAKKLPKRWPPLASRRNAGNLHHPNVCFFSKLSRKRRDLDHEFIICCNIH